MNLTLCMIVKNEENNIRRCLNSIQDSVNEIIIVDTGSNDYTKEISRLYTDKVHDFKWSDSFADARNYAASLSNNDWILVLDADEYCLDFNKKSLENLLTNDNFIGRIKIINRFSERESVEFVSRVYNKKYYVFEGIIHEQLIPQKKLTVKHVNLDLKVYHTGYDEKYVDLNQKATRNIDLLKESINKNPLDIYLFYQLGKSYFMIKKYNEAVEAFEKALSLEFDFRHEYVEDLVESYGYSLLNLGRYADAFEKIKVYEPNYVNSPDFVFLLSLMNMNLYRIDAAIRCFNKCLNMNGGRTTGITTYLPLYNLGVIYECLGDKKNAIYYYQNCGDYKPAKDRLLQLSN